MVLVDPEELSLVLNHLARCTPLPPRTRTAFMRLREASQHDDYGVTLPTGDIIHVYGPNELKHLADALGQRDFSIDPDVVKLPTGATGVRLTRWSALDRYIRPDGTSPWFIHTGSGTWVPLRDHGQLTPGPSFTLLCLVPEPETVEVPKAALAALLGRLHESDFHVDTVRLITELRDALEDDHA